MFNEKSYAVSTTERIDLHTVHGSPEQEMFCDDLGCLSALLTIEIILERLKGVSLYRIIMIPGSFVECFVLDLILMSFILLYL